MRFGRRRAGCLRCVAALACLLVALAVVQVAPSGRALAEPDVDVEVGVNGRFEPNDQLIVRVTITADELIDGQIVSSLEEMGIDIRQPIQVPAGTTKTFYFLIPSGWDMARIEVSIRDGDTEVANERVSGRQAEGELVGVLPRLAARIGELPDDDIALGEHLGDAVIGDVPTEIIDLGVPALRSYDTLVAGADDISALTDAQQQVLWGWVSTGGILLLDDEAAASSVPDEWHVGPAGYSLAGLGEIRLTDGEAAAGRWSAVIPPTAAGTAWMMWGPGEMMWAEDGPNSQLVSRAGLDLPTIAPLAIGLGVYGLVLGPIIFLLLRRMRRLTLGWFVIPALAVVTAGGVAVAGGGALRSGDPAAAVFLQNTPGGSAYALSNLLTFSSNGGSADVDLPSGWTLSSNTFFWDGTTTPITITRNADGTSLSSVSLEATQANIRLYAGTTDGVGLTTSARYDGDRDIVGTVTNDTDLTFSDVAVFGFDSEVEVGTLGPGEEFEWTIRAPRDMRFNMQQRGPAVWGNPMNMRGQMAVAEDLGVEWGIWGNASTDLDLFPSAMVRVVGWTDAIASELLDTDASTVTGVSSLAAVTSDDHRVAPATVRMSAVRGPFTMFGGGNDQVTRYVLPPDADTDELFLTDMGGVDAEEVAFWDGEAWVDVTFSDNVVPVPAEAVRGGTVLVRTDVDMNRGPTGVPTLTDQAPA